MGDLNPPLIVDRPCGFASHLQKETFWQCWLTKSPDYGGGLKPKWASQKGFILNSKIFLLPPALCLLPRPIAQRGVSDRAVNLIDNFFIPCPPSLVITPIQYTFVYNGNNEIGTNASV